MTDFSDVVDMLIEENENVNAVGRDDHATALTLATRKSHLAIVNILALQLRVMLMFKKKIVFRH